jgi:hypothetical protein
MMKMFVSSFNAVPLYFIYHTLANINIVEMIGRWVSGGEHVSK